MLIKLRKKIQYKTKEKDENGKIQDAERDLEEIELNFEDLTGKDLIAANKEAVKIEGPSLSPIISMAYQAVITAKAARIPLDAVMKMSAPDFTAVTNAAQDFLLSSGFKM